MEDVYVDFAKDVEICFNKWNSEVDRLLLIGRIKKSDWINERWIESKNNDKICYNKTKKKAIWQMTVVMIKTQRVQKST